MKELKTPEQILDENELTGKLYCHDSNLNQRDRDDIIYAMNIHATQVKDNTIQRVLAKLTKHKDQYGTLFPQLEGWLKEELTPA